MEVEPKVGEIWFSEYNWRHIFITQVDREIIHFYFLDNPEELNSRTKYTFHGVYSKYEDYENENFISAR